MSPTVILALVGALGLAALLLILTLRERKEPPE